MRVPRRPLAKSHAAHPRATVAIMTVEILKMLQVENLARSGNSCDADLA
jgi:hypothetical protein